MSEDKDVDAYLEEIKFAFHEWKHHKVTKILSKHLRKISDDLTTLLLSNATRDCNDDIRLSFYYRCAAKIELITQLLNLTLEDVGEIVGYLSKEESNEL